MIINGRYLANHPIKSLKEPRVKACDNIEMVGTTYILIRVCLYLNLMYQFFAL